MVQVRQIDLVIVADLAQSVKHGQVRADRRLRGQELGQARPGDYEVSVATCQSAE